MIRLIACIVLFTCTSIYGVAFAALDQEPSTDESSQSGSEAGVSESNQSPSPLNTDGNLIDAQRDIVPILRDNCLACHGPDDAKNDFRVDDHDSMMDYIESGDVESSSLFVDYLTTDDPDYLMPPPSKGGPLSTTELALIRVWIEEGAVWPENLTFTDISDTTETERNKTEQALPKDLQTRLWMAQGFLHPATVHFPIALLTVGGFFVVVGWKWPRVGTQIPLAALWLGSLSAIVSTAMGWAFAPEQGYGSNWTFLDFDREVDAHRWSAVIVSVATTFFSIVALVAVMLKSERLTKIWKIGLLLSAGMVGAVGHQGGEMTYGKDFYPRAIRILLGQPENNTPIQEESRISEESSKEAELITR